MEESLSLDVEKFEEKLGLNKGFSFGLLAEDDWSFLIKLSALVEATCTHTLAVKFGYPDLEESFSYLDQANYKVGRVALLKKIGALYEHQAATLQTLAMLRNSTAHNVKNSNFKFKEYLKHCKQKDKETFIKHFGIGLHEKIELFNKEYTREEYVQKFPKFSVYATIIEIIACLYLEVKSVHISLELLSPDEI